MSVTVEVYYIYRPFGGQKGLTKIVTAISVLESVDPGVKVPCEQRGGLFLLRGC